jgi:hypothetical protein
VGNSIIVQHSPSRVALMGANVEYESAAIYFDKSRSPEFELETYDSDIMLVTLYRSVAPKSLSL